jgi:hypothetical protein
MDIYSSIIAGFGLSAPAGLNAWIPLLVTSVAAKIGWLKLNAPFDVLGETWVLVVLLALVTIELFVDKIPAIDSINDIIHTLIRPTAGGILFASQAGIIGGLDPTVGFILGVLSAGAVHAVKASSRPLVTTFSGGIFNPIVSMVEDIISAVTAVLALLVPILAAFIMLLLLGVAGWAILRWRARRRRRQAAQAQAQGGGGGGVGP